MINPLLRFLSENWTAGIEILLLAVSIYYGYLYFRGTRGAKVFTGLAILFIFLTLVSQILNLTVISWLLRRLTAFIAVALIVIFLPQMRSALTDLSCITLSYYPLSSHSSYNIGVHHVTSHSVTV